MTDKEKIREVVKKRYEYWREKESNSHSIESEIRMSECQHLLLMLDSLQEEPVSRTPADIKSAMQEVEEKSKAFTEAHQGGDADTILMQMRGKEPVSDELEEAAKGYSNNLDNICGSIGKQTRNAFKAGAKWQKEQMMKDAVDAEIYREIENDDTREYSLHAISHKLDKSKYKFMEKVKVIIIKEKWV